MRRSGLHVATAATPRAPSAFATTSTPASASDQATDALPRTGFIVDDHDAERGYCRHQRTISNEWRSGVSRVAMGLSDRQTKESGWRRSSPPLRATARRSDWLLPYKCSRRSRCAQTNPSRHAGTPVESSRGRPHPSSRISSSRHVDTTTRDDLHRFRLRPSARGRGVPRSPRAAAG